MKRYANVIIDISLSSLDRPFCYHIPDRLEEKVNVGNRVEVPFGRGNNPRKAYVISLLEEPDCDPSIVKDIIGVSGESVSIEEKQFELAAFIKRNFGGTMNQALHVVLPAKAKVKQLLLREVVRTLGREELLSLKGEALRKKNQNAKVKLLDALLEQESIPYEWITGKLGVSASTIRSLEKAGALRIDSVTKYRNPVHVNKGEGPTLTLSASQQAIVDSVKKDIDESRPGEYLIHGITGSGKTEVYMTLAEIAVSRGEQVIFMIPEIALTYQTLVRFYQRFGSRVSVMNSTLSPGERYDQCMRAAAGEIDVIIGPRSALFVPFPNLGMIIIDEEHETSYKSENTPRYHAVRVAEYIARRENAALILGSATPSLESYYKAEKGEIKLFELNERLTGGSLPEVTVTDMRQELKEGNRSIFSRKLQALLKDRIEKNEQAMLFLNRRGYAGFISCRECGEVIKCPHCDVSLSEHYGGKLVCHYCGYETAKPKKCPSCGSGYIAGFKAGTEQIEEKLKEMFPGVTTLRMDADTTKTKDSYEKILSSFMNGEAQVLIGTQMIVKGHDFPNVTLVGIIAADISLNGSDHRSGERTFQLLAQAAGRAGRGTLPGNAVIQTYRPDHYAVVHAAAQDYKTFYSEEIAYRRLMGYPPAAHMLGIRTAGPDRARAEKLAGELAEIVRKGPYKVPVLGPAPAAIEKLKDMYRYVVYIKAEDYDILVNVKDSLEEYILGQGAGGCFVQFDFDQ